MTNSLFTFHCVYKEFLLNIFDKLVPSCTERYTYPGKIK